MLVMVDYVTKMAAKKSCKYGEYGSLEHLPFLLLHCYDSTRINIQGASGNRTQDYCSQGGRLHHKASESLEQGGLFVGWLVA